MKGILYTLLTLIVMGLCGILGYQWRREFLLNARITELTAALLAENKLRLEFEEKAERFEKEIARISNLRLETEAALLDATETVQQMTLDQSARGYSLALWMNEAQATQTELSAYKKLAGEGSDAIKNRNTEVGAQNEAIKQANDNLRKLVGERDDLIGKLNARTKEYNELVEKYNKLAKQGS